NASAIALLDNAIASAAGQIREKMSIEELAARSKVGDNIYPQFVKQKLNFLDSPEGQFYYRGVFELETMELLANALESTYFLDRSDQNKLVRELKLIDDIFLRMKDEKYNYILRNRKGTQTDLNSTKFWRASILFALHERDQLKAALNDLINTNWRFVGQSAEVGHLFIYKPFDLPYEIIVRPGKDTNGHQNFEVHDSHR